MRKFRSIEGMNSLFASQESNLSDKYHHIPTIDIINVMDSQGWVPCGGYEAGRRRNSPKRFDTVKHGVRFQNTKFTARYSESTKVLGQLVPQITIRNSHDGSSSFRVELGFMRLVCLNGLMVSEEYGSFRISHHSAKAAMDELEAKIAAIAEGFDAIIALYNKLAATEFNLEQLKELINSAVTVTYGKDVASQVDINKATDELLTVHRDADRDNNVFNLFNRAQETLVQGNTVRGNKRVRKLGQQRADEVTSRLFDAVMRIAA